MPLDKTRYQVYFQNIDYVEIRIFKMKSCKIKECNIYVLFLICVKYFADHCLYIVITNAEARQGKDGPFLSLYLE